MRKLLTLGLLAGLVTLAALAALPAGAHSPGQNGRILFGRYDPTIDNNVIYTVKPDGSNGQQLIPGPPRHLGDEWRWSPDGSKIATLGTDVDAGATAIITVDTGSYVRLAMPDPDIFTACDVWSPDMTRLACEGFGQTNPSLNGIYTIRSSDGGGLTRMTSNPGGDDQQGDYSPDGNRFVFGRFDQNGDSVGLFVINVHGARLKQITPSGTSSNGDWSSQGNEIVFSRHVTVDVRSSIWVVHADGTGLHEIQVQTQRACGGSVSDPTSIGCFGPRWSPDGKKIVFGIFSAATGQRDIYTANADGSNVQQATNSPTSDEGPDWGTHPLTG
jgi:Tol biopolymer transport system component